jgi:hypothetical protein
MKLPLHVNRGQLPLHHPMLDVLKIRTATTAQHNKASMLCKNTCRTDTAGLRSAALGSPHHKRQHALQHLPLCLLLCWCLLTGCLLLSVAAQLLLVLLLMLLFRLPRARQWVLFV